MLPPSLVPSLKQAADALLNRPLWVYLSQALGWGVLRALRFAMLLRGSLYIHGYQLQNRELPVRAHPGLARSRTRPPPLGTGDR